MTKDEYWNLFRLTGKIEYYLEYKKLAREDDTNDKKNIGDSSQRNRL